MILLSLTLNEFYSESIGRIFDYFAIILIILNFTISYNKYRLKKKYFSIFIYFSLFILLGLLSQQFLASLAVFSGAFFIVLFVRTSLDDQKLYFIKSIQIIISIHLFFFFVQIFLFYFLNLQFSIIDLIPGLQSSRVFNEGLGILRPGGLMMEPNSYCANIFMLTFVLYKLVKKIDLLSKIALSSVLLTTSIWGTIILVTVLFLFANFKNKILLTIIVIISSIYIINKIDDSIAIERLFRIIDDPYSDNSVVTRLGLESKKPNNFINWIFGNGINSKGFQEFMGGNGFSYMLYCFGIIGTTIFLFWYYMSNGLNLLILFLLFNFTFPYFSYLIFYLFLSFSFKDVTYIFNQKNNLLTE